jgi:uncharacterized membrane protein YagU involved in acid resistance
MADAVHPDGLGAPGEGREPAKPASITLPAATAAPLVVSLGMALLAAGVALGMAFVIAGAIVLFAGLGVWVGNLLPGRGHVVEAAQPEEFPQPVVVSVSRVEHLRPGMPGYRARLPAEVHPVSAGIKGGIVGGLVMPLPALIYGLLSGHGIWYPANLLAGMVWPGVGSMSLETLEQFNSALLITGLIIHAAMSVVIGLIYGVILPTLPAIPGPVAWGGLLMPLLWTGISFSLMGLVNPVLRQGVSWPWFIISQFIFGVAAAGVCVRAKQLRPVAAGLLGGVIGGLLMPLPAILWSAASGHGVWYPVNLLAAMVLPGLTDLPRDQLNAFHGSWLAVGLAIHAILSLGFGALYGVLLTRLPSISGSLAWGGLLFPLPWTGLSYGLMGVVNPVLQERVDWPWFIISQFVFGAVAAAVVDRSEKISIPPAGVGEEANL